MVPNVHAVSTMQHMCDTVKTLHCTYKVHVSYDEPDWVCGTASFVIFCILVFSVIQQLLLQANIFHLVLSTQTLCNILCFLFAHFFAHKSGIANMQVTNVMMVCDISNEPSFWKTQVHWPMAAGSLFLTRGHFGAQNGEKPVLDNVNLMLQMCLHACKPPACNSHLTS